MSRVKAYARTLIIIVKAYARTLIIIIIVMSRDDNLKTSNI